MNHKRCMAAFGCAGDSIKMKAMKTSKLLPGGMILSAKTHAENFLPVPAFPVQMSGAPLPTRTLNAANAAPGSLPSPCGGFLQPGAFASAPRPAEAMSILVVDDVESLTELYTDFLEAAGYIVWAFNDRAEALAALKADRAKPDLLITDYCGLSMSVDQFMRDCLLVHPTLRILMASGFSRTDMRFSQPKPDRFIQKPFTPEELRREVTAALTTKQPGRSKT